MLSNFPNVNFQDQILSEVHNSNASFNFAEIYSTYKNHSATFYIFNDALKIENIRVNVSAATMQKIANHLNCILPTAKLYDLMYSQAQKKIPPKPRAISSTKDAMIAHSLEIDQSITNSNIIATVGKVWILDNNTPKDMACNYGWHFEGDSYQGIRGDVTASGIVDSAGKPIRMIQSRGYRHNSSHCDYSQICILVSKECIVDGENKNIEDVLKDPELSFLANHSGVLKSLEQK